MLLSLLPRWWHLLSLDAPTVAALWSWSLAGAMGVRLPMSSLLLLALGTWLVYAADRILDGLLAASGGVLRQRHFFYVRHRRAFLMAALPAVALLVWLIAARMNAAARREDFGIFAVAVAYFCVIHGRGMAARWLPKELAVGAVFAAACAVPAWSRLPVRGLASAHGVLFGMALTFAGMCWLNCVAIEKWEFANQAVGGLHWSTVWAQEHFRRLCGALAGSAALAGVLVLILGPQTGVAAIFLAAAGTFAGLLTLDAGRKRWRLSALSLRIAADAAMLTPLLFVTALR